MRGKWRTSILAALVIGPMIVYMILGILWLKQRGWAVWGGAIWVATGLISAVLADRWTKTHRTLLPPIDWDSPAAFSEVDRGAWEIVQQEARSSDLLSLEELMQADVYFETAKRLTTHLAEHYQPRSSHPIERLAIADLLTAIELAAEDLGRLCHQVPGADLVTMGHFQTAVRAAGLIQKANDYYSYLLPLAQPISGLARLGAQQWLGKPAWRNTSQNVLRWFFSAYVNRLGVHLVELYSGRLAIGADTYRRLRRQTTDDSRGKVVPRPSAMSTIRALVLGSDNATVVRNVAAVREVCASKLDSVRHAARIRGFELDLPTLIEIAAIDWVERPGFPASDRDGAPELVHDYDIVIAWMTSENVDAAVEFLTQMNEAREVDAIAPIVVVADGLDSTTLEGVRSAGLAVVEAILEFTESAVPDEAAADLLVGLAPVLPGAARIALLRHVRAFSNQSTARRVVNQLGVQTSRIWKNFRTSRRAARSVSKPRKSPTADP